MGVGERPALVFAPDRGVGDLMWHLPTIRGIAEASGQPVVLVTRPSTRATALLSAEPSVCEIAYATYHSGTWKRLAEARDLYRLCKLYQPSALWVLEKTWPGAAGGFLAGVSSRHGFGLGYGQELFLTGPRLPKTLAPQHRIAKLAALERVHDLKVASREPNLPLPRTGAEAIAPHADRPRPWIVMGVTASEGTRFWPLDRFSAVATRLVERTGGTVFWLGDPGIVADVDAHLGPGQVNVSALRLDAAAHLIAAADLFLGVDSGPMNLAASLGRPALGLYGPTPPLTYSRWLSAVTPRNPAEGMLGITVDQVAAAAERLIGDETLAPSPSRG